MNQPPRGPGDPGGEPPRAPRRGGPGWLVAALLAAAAASTLTTALAAAVAGRQADLPLRPVELALRVALLLGAPCVGALLAAMVVPRGAGRAAVVAVGLGVPVGPLLVLRLDRVTEFGPGPTLLVAGVLAAWAVVGAFLAAGWWDRPVDRVERTELPEPGPIRGPTPGGVPELPGEPGGFPGGSGPAA